MTLCVYVLVDALAQKCRRHPLVNPVLLSVLVIGAVLLMTGTDHRTYFDGAQFIYFMLGPATVALAIPLYQNRALVRRSLVPMLVALVCGSLVACVSAVMIAAALGAPPDLVVSIAPKSVTAGVAMSISEGLGGDPALTAVLVMCMGIIGAVVVTPLMNALKITDFRARGFAIGLASHGIGTARAFQVSPVAGTFAGIAIGLNAGMTAFLVPWVMSLIYH